MLGELSNVVNENTPISVGSAVAVCSVVSFGGLYVGKWMQKVNDSLKDLKKNFTSLPCQNCKNNQTTKNEK